MELQIKTPKLPSKKQNYVTVKIMNYWKNIPLSNVSQHIKLDLALAVYG